MRRMLVPLALLLFTALPAAAEPIAPESALKVGDRAPIFSLVDQHGNLVDYDRDYYGSHHLVVTFFPAAFTPV